MFCQLDKESKSEKNGAGWWAVGGGLDNIREQMFLLALLLFKDNTCAKLF